MRITAQLIDVATDVHVWSRSYERDLTPANVFEIQSDITSQISEALQVKESVVCFNKPSPTDSSLWPSDHAGVWADLVLP